MKVDDNSVCKVEAAIAFHLSSVCYLISGDIVLSDDCVGGSKCQLCRSLGINTRLPESPGPQACRCIHR